MNLSNYTEARKNFLSSYESIGTLDFVGPDVEANMTLDIKSIKSLLGYFSVIHNREVITQDRINIVNPNIVSPDENTSFGAFMEKTLINTKQSFYFQATTFAHREPLIFSDNALLGDKNVYKPFDSLDSSGQNSMLTATLAEIRSFSNQNFKLKNYRGVATFQLVDILRKGYIIYLTDKHLYLMVIAAKYQDINNYTAILFVKD